MTLGNTDADRRHRWTAGERTYVDRMPPLPSAELDARQRELAQALASGPRGGVKGPFIPLLRSPDLAQRLGDVGEYLRFGSSLDARVRELVMLYVAREWTNHFEWNTHAPLARARGVADETISALAQGRRPNGMADDEAVAYAICDELSRHRGVSDATWQRALGAFGAAGLIDVIAIYGYFVTVCAIMNAAHTPPPAAPDAPAMHSFPS